MNNYSYKILRSRRKTIALQITPAGEILVRCPNRCSQGTIQAFVDSKRPWLEKHLTAIQARPSEPPFTPAQLEALYAQARELLPRRVAHYAALIGVSYGRITIRAQRTRWGSCSSKGNLNFNCLLALCPEEVVDYIVIHELCHRKELNHSGAFWALVEQFCPDYQVQKQWLNQNGPALMARLSATSTNSP